MRIAITRNGLISVAPESDEVTLEVTYLSNLLSDLECKEGGVVISQKEKVRLMVEIIHGEIDFRHKITFCVPFAFIDELQADKPDHLLGLQNTKKWVIECIKRGIVPLSVESVELYQL